jgi:hypothetical protein
MSEDDWCNRTCKDSKFVDGLAVVSGLWAFVDLSCGWCIAVLIHGLLSSLVGYGMMVVSLSTRLSIAVLFRLQMQSFVGLGMVVAS